MPVLKQCCCCCSVQTGSYVVGVYVLVVNFIGFVGSAYAVFNPAWLRLKIEEELCGWPRGGGAAAESGPDYQVGGDPAVVGGIRDGAVTGGDGTMCTPEYIEDTMELARYISIGDMCLNIVVIGMSVLLIVGICKKKPCLMLPFIVMLILVLVASGVLIIIMFIALQMQGAGQYAIFVCLYGIVFALHLYMALCVISHYQELRSSNASRHLYGQHTSGGCGAAGEGLMSNGSAGAPVHVVTAGHPGHPGHPAGHTTYNPAYYPPPPPAYSTTVQLPPPDEEKKKMMM